MHKIKQLLLLWVLASPLFLVAQKGDTLKLFRDNGITNYCSANGFEYTADSLTGVDNTLNHFQNYVERNNLGNVGLPINDLIYKSLQGGVAFNYAKNNYQSYFLTPQNLKFYTTRSPFTDLFYVAGSKKEGIFKMTFSYNVKKNWNVTLHFSRIRSEGFYKRNKTLDNFIGLTSNYKTKNNRYWLLVSGGFNSIKNEESGGIVNDSAFVTGGTTDRLLMGMNLSSASRNVANTNVMIKQFLNFGKKSTDTASLGNIITGSRLILTSSYTNYALKYEDNVAASGFYQNIYIDSSKTLDTAFTYTLGNELEWKRVDNGKHRGLNDLIGFGVSAKDEIVRVKQQETDSTFNNVMVGGSVYNTYSNHSFYWKAGVNYGVSGYNKDDYRAELVIKKKLMDSLFTVTLYANTKAQAPDFIYNKYVSNNFRWNNNFNKTSEWKVGGDVEIKKIKLSVGADFRVIKNILYFDNYAIAKQFKGEVPVFSAFLKKDFKLGNWHLDNLLRYQFVPDSMVIRIPAVVLEHSIYYSANNLFKGALNLQIGASVYYSSEYYANAYMPAAGEFYLQNEQKLGNYPFIDLFLNAKIKSVRVFVKIDHINSGLMGNNYMLTPHYPYNDRMYKIGISWRFWD